jgi:protein involved in polysaccharide export with SLBB domain
MRQLMALLVLAGLFTACASAGVPMSEIAAEINATRDRHPARFLPGDQIDLRFGRLDPEPEADQSAWDQTVEVDAEGRASFRLVGNLQVLGKSPDDVEGELEDLYAEHFIERPELSVNLLGQNPDTDIGATNRPIHVLGEVRAPGSIPYLGRELTLVEALARAGSFDKRSALLKQVLLVRWMPEGGEDGTYRAWKIDARPEQWGSPEQIRLQAFDVVFVPQKPIDKVNIWVDQYIRQMIPFPYLIPPIF